MVFSIIEVASALHLSTTVFYQSHLAPRCGQWGRARNRGAGGKERQDGSFHQRLSRLQRADRLVRLSLGRGCRLALGHGLHDSGCRTPSPLS